MKHFIPYGRQYISEEDIKAVVEVLKSPFITQGPAIQKFEEAFANYVGAKYAVAVSSGTAALHLSALVLGTNKSSIVITTPITFAASANCVEYCNGTIDFIDIELDTYLIDLNKLEEKLDNSPKGSYTGIIPVDFAGYPIDMERLQKIGKKHGLWIIEDACHSPGGYYIDSNGKKQLCGNGVKSNLTVFSFHPVKHVATGEGGMITTNDFKLYQQLLRLRTHGITKEESLLDENHGGWYYEMKDLGYNYRLTDIQATLGISQLKRATQGVLKRQKIAEYYNTNLKDLPLKLPGVKENINHAYHLYVILTERRKQLYNYLKKYNIFCQVHYIPVHLHPYYRSKGWKKGDLPIAEKYYDQCLSLPIYPTLDKDSQDYVIEKIRKFFNE